MALPNRDRGHGIQHAIHVDRDRGEPRHPIEGVASAPAWMDGRELCAQADPEVFHPDKGASVAEAKAVCARCELREPCLAWALETNQRFGVWGGASERERRRLRGAA
jgi:WhiB family redox-sensing transcriptional regulator